MANIVYLRPQDRPESPAAAREDSPRLRTAIAQAHFAAILTSETVSRSGPLPPRAAALLSRIEHAGEPSRKSAGPVVTVSGAAQRNPPLAGARAASGTGDAQQAIQLPSAPDMFAVASVVGGNIHLQDIAETSGPANETRAAALKLKSHYIAVPDDILVARQNRTHTIAFSVNSLEALAHTLGEIVRHNRHMVENWAANNGGRPPLNLRYQARAPFGRIAHVGAQSASDLRAVAVRLTREHGTRHPFFTIELALSHRAG